MPFYLNPFSSDFSGVWVLSDRQYSLDFRIPRNSGRGDEYVVAHSVGTYDLSGTDADGDDNDTLNIVFALNDPKNWIELPITITGASMSAVNTTEIVSSLNTNDLFSNYFIAKVEDQTGDGRYRVTIRQKQAIGKFRFYIKQNQAETLLKFNKFIGVGEAPAFFSRHTIANRFTYPDGQNHIVELDPNNLTVDANTIDAALDSQGVSKGYDSGTIKADWELLRGRAGIFSFQKITVDGSDRITNIIEYPAGAIKGDMARQITYTYAGANTKPDQITEVPYVLDTGDLVTP